MLYELNKLLTATIKSLQIDLYILDSMLFV